MNQIKKTIKKMKKLGCTLFNFNKDHVKDENNYLFFQAGQKISILEENNNWGWGYIDQNFGFFPLLYLCFQDINEHLGRRSSIVNDKKVIRLI